MKTMSMPEDFPEKTAGRACEICHGRYVLQIHRQRFLFPEKRETVYYDVVACKNCGFVYADGIPRQAELDQFYEASQHHLHAMEIPDGLIRIHASFFDFVQQNLPLSADARILDVGSSIGHFLSHFKMAGYRNLTGLEPSQSATALAAQRYGIHVVADTLEHFPDTAPFDLICMTGVLEHVADLERYVEHLAKRVAVNGWLFIAVPDAESFGEKMPAEPYLEFAFEHINFFSCRSLENLLSSSGFSPMAVMSQENDFYHNKVIIGLYQKKSAGNPDGSPKRDDETRYSIWNYCKLSQEKLVPLARRIETLAQNEKSLIVWGAGSLCKRLFCDTALADCKIVQIWDRNPQLHGKHLSGIRISPPSSIYISSGSRDMTVLIASSCYQDEIARYLQEEMQWRGEILFVDGSSHFSSL
jgi:SAM-dependent methyltransferase